MIGVLIYQLSLDEMNDLMQVPIDFWRTGEAYLVGDDYFARTQTLLSQPQHFFEQKIDSLAVHKGLMGESGVATIDGFRGSPY
ncbi:hypothetical protein P4S72_21785 [Vibrio sp. PP-XX7]